MTLGDKIRRMTNEQLASFLWRYSLNVIASYSLYGEEHVKRFSETYYLSEIKDWLEENFNTADPWFTKHEE